VTRRSPQDAVDVSCSLAHIRVGSATKDMGAAFRDEISKESRGAVKAPRQKRGKFMNKFLGLGFGLVRADTCRPNSLNQAKLVTVIAAMLALSTTYADAAKRHVGKAPRFATHDFKVVPIHAGPAPSYWMYRLCSPAARAADPYTVCFLPAERPYLGRDPDANIRFQLRRDYPSTIDAGPSPASR
jgi:hypothetical protein